MNSYRLSPQAEAEEQADKYLSELKLKALRYARGERQGKSCARFLPERTDLHYFLHGRHLVLYRLQGSVLEIATVIHGSSQERLMQFLGTR